MELRACQMREVDMEERDWCEEIRVLLSTVPRLEECLYAIAQQEVTSIEAHVNVALSATGQVRQAASSLFALLCAEPSGRFLRGRALSRQQYYLVRAMGADFGSAYALGLSPLPDDEVFGHLCYEDEQWVGYINPSLEPRGPDAATVGMRVGRPPEELSRRALRSDQAVFFADVLPEVLARFGE